jgi:hypothetical protein
MTDVNGNIVKMTVSVVGSRRLFWHAFKPSALPLTRQEKKGVPGNDPEEWKDTVLYDEKTRELYLPGNYFFSAIRNAGRHTKKKGSSNYMKWIAATLQVEDERVFVGRKLPNEPSTEEENEVYIDVRGVKNPSTRGRNVRYRVATQKGWDATFTICFDRMVVPVEVMKAIIHDAGSLVGVGDARSIGMGRFEVTKFSVID